MVSPALANPPPPSAGSFRIFVLARWPQIIPGMNPNGPRTTVAIDKTSEAMASPEVLGTGGSGGGKSTAGGAAWASGPGSGTVWGFEMDSFGSGTGGGGGMTIVF